MLSLLTYESSEACRSQELRYLAATNLAAARQVYGSVVEARWRPGHDEPALDENSPLLVFGRESTHLGARSLERMKAAIDAGAPVVAPDPLSAFDLRREDPVYTLRGFERLEQRILDRKRKPHQPSLSHLPVALFSPSFRKDKLAGVPVETLLTDGDLLHRLSAAGDLAHAGVCHTFIDYYGEVREDILPFLPPTAADVLEVGCGRGLTGAFLQDRLGCRVTGVELNPEVASDAGRRLHRVIVGDIESCEIGERFDAVVATELFEHLQDPLAFLVRIKALLRPGGRIVMSVPNVGHYSIVEDLLAGRWDYLPIGLLCYTHCRFFTRATLESWISRVGFSSFEIVAQKTGLPRRIGKIARHFETDRESLATSGFYVVINVG